MTYPKRHNIAIAPTSTRYNSITIDPIQETIEAVESHEDDASLPNREIVKIFGVNKSTLLRTH